MQGLDQLFLDLQQALAGEYSLERELGRGGMGVVYLAREVQLDRLVAIKVLPRERAEFDNTREQFLKEARTAAQLFHPSIVPIYRVGEAAGLPYFVMAYVDGETLGERLRRRGPVVASAMQDILRDVAQALGYAHGRGVVHRDIKPDNILLERESGRALVSDFGIAGRVDDFVNQDARVGTVQFMSPEQLRGEAVDGRADLYALGVVAFLALSGNFPDSIDATVASTSPRFGVKSQSNVVALASSALPPGLTRVVEICLMRDATKRWANAEEMLNALDHDRPMRAKLPAVLREWARPTWLLGALSVWSIGVVAMGLEVGTSSLGRGLLYWYSEHSKSEIALLTILPLIPFALLHLYKTRLVLAAGHTLQDLKFALRFRDSSNGADDIDSATERENRNRRILRAVMLTGLTLTALATVAMYVWGYSTTTGQRNTTLPRPFPRDWLFGVSAVGRWAFNITASGTVLLGTLGVSILPPQFEKRTLGRLRENFWNSRSGEWLAAKLTPKHRAIPATDFRPTEMALGSAAEDLFAALPTRYRESLAELPTVVARLASRAGVQRESLQRLANLMNSGGAAASQELASRVSNARSELSETVSALERIRMDLLRLHGGLADFRPITSSLEAARQLQADITRLRDAQEEVASPKLLPIDVRTPTPA